MPSNTATVIAYVGAFVGLVGGGVALFNSWKAVAWKRAELANSYLKDLKGNPELVFACRCLDWHGGRLVVPDSLLPLTDDHKYIKHDQTVFARALRPDLRVDELDEDPRIQLYRTAQDALLSWLSLIASALSRRLFKAADMEEIGYWIAKFQSEPATHNFICTYGYQENINKLIVLYRRKKAPYRNWGFFGPKVEAPNDLIVRRPSRRGSTDEAGSTTDHTSRSSQMSPHYCSTLEQSIFAEWGLNQANTRRGVFRVNNH
jgi:hypothetical protein